MRAIATISLLSVLFVSGCKGSGEGIVTGTVTYKSKPLICGKVFLVFDDGNTSSGLIVTNGSGAYTIPTQFRGHARIAVRSQKPVVKVDSERGAPPPGSEGADPAKWFEIPSKYESAETSGKEMTVTNGTNKQDIVLD